MKRLLTILLALVCSCSFAQMRGGAQYDPDAARRNLSNNTALTLKLAGSGTAAAPAYSFAADPDTGIYSAGADAIGFSANASELGRLSAAGMVLADELDLTLSASNAGHVNRLQWAYGGTPYAWIERVNADGSMAFTVHPSERMRISGGGNVLIGTSTDDGVNKLQVNGFTKLGEAATGLKCKVLTGTTASTQGGLSTVAHGLTASKIIAYSTEMHYDADNSVPPGYTFYSGLQYDVQKGPSDMIIYNSAANSSSVLSKPFTILIWYKG